MSDISIPGFEIVGKIGEGGMASVWKARQVSLDRVVAIKILTARTVRDAEDIDRFQAEARAAAKLKHPGIVQVHDANAEEDLYYFVMEYVAGYTVGDWVRRKGILKEKDALLVADCVADALGYAWTSAGIVHCDVKPDNVMIDADGTVKVADLGLARTINAMSMEEAAEEVMGTPAYVSPEQAAGEPVLDCRTDIYSLGATLYHLLTGRPLFHDRREEDIMSLQITGTAPHPYDLNPKLSKGICCLIEKMLAKNKDDRENSWDAVRADIARVRRGLLPQPLPATAESTVAKPRTQHTDWHQVQKHALDVHRKRQKKSLFSRKAIIAVVLFFLLLGIGIFIPARKAGPKPAAPALPTVPVREAEPPREEDTNLQRAAGALERATGWSERNPGQYEEAIRRFEGVAEIASGTPYADKAREEIQRLGEARAQLIDNVMAGLDAQAAVHVESGAYLAAAGVYESYRGTMDRETTVRRLNTASALRMRHASSIKAMKDRELTGVKMKETVENAADTLLHDGLAAAITVLSEAIEDPSLAEHRADLEADLRLLSAAEGVGDRILTSFQDDRGKTVKVLLKTRPITGTIVEAAGDSVTMEIRLPAGKAKTTFRLGDLSSYETLARMGPGDDPAVTLAKGVMAMEAQAYAHAAKYFGGLTSPLGRRLCSLAEEAGEDQCEVEVGTESELPVTPPSTPSPGRPPRPRATVYLPPELEAIRGNAEAVVRLLIHKNPGLEKERVSATRNEEGQVVSLKIASGIVDNIEPVSALTDLETFRYDGVNASEPGRLSDISPLKELRLEECSIVNCLLADITPIRFHPLRSLTLARTRLRDIMPLKDMALERLDLSGTKVVNFYSLRGMPLQYLNLSDTQLKDTLVLKNMPLSVLLIKNTRVYDFSFLREFSLNHLDLTGTQIRDLSVLSDMPLNWLGLRDTNVSDISPVKGKELRYLDLAGDRITDFTPLRGMGIEVLNLSGTQFEDVGVLNGMKIVELRLNGTRVKDLWALQGMPLQHLDISGTPVTSLDPLKGAPLKSLNCSGTSVASLAPLKGAPLKSLNCRGTKVRDFSPLLGSSIESLDLDSPRNQHELIRSLARLQLRRVNGMSVEEAFRR